jgi:hypothetical protein
VKYILRTLGVLVLGAVLAGCSSGFEGGELESQVVSLTGLKWVTNTKKTFTAPDPTDPGKYNCVTTEFDIPPQGYRAQGSTGGLTYTAFASATTARSVGSSLKANFLGGFNPTQDTEILVVDDFGKWSDPKFTLPTALFYPSFTGISIQDFIDSGDLSHGALVMRHTNDAVVGAGLYTSGTPYVSVNDGMTFYTTPYQSLTNNRRFKVAAVNTRLQNQAVIAGTTTPLITTRDVVTAITAYKKEFTSIVINMSFVLLPCEVFEDFEQSGSLTLESYLEQLAFVNQLATNRNGVIDTNDEQKLMVRIVESTNQDNDPLKRLIRAEANTDIFVAASGNYALPYSMYPAKWPGVVNVTGSHLANQNVRAADLFNAGEVMSIGSLFGIAPPGSSGTPVFYFGTSYATPSVSVYSALDLAGKQRCTDTNNQSLKSELALDGVSFALTDKRLENLYNNNNLMMLIPGAIQIRCGTN